jgi:hypothetical protein
MFCGGSLESCGFALSSDASTATFSTTVNCCEQRVLRELNTRRGVGDNAPIEESRKKLTFVGSAFSNIDGSGDMNRPIELA